MIQFIDNLIDRITMYRLLLYYLLFIMGAAMLFGAIGWLSFSPVSILITNLILVGLCYVFNFLLAKLFDAPSNTESAILTGLILTLIITPISSPGDATFLVAAAGLAMASKYFLAYKHKHIFNPVAIAVVLTAYGAHEAASWWVGTVTLLPIVIIGGLLLARKIRRGSMVLAFIAAALVSTVFFAALGGRDVSTILQFTLLQSSLFFLAFVMLTEPWTSPTTKNKRFVYAGIVGLLFAPTLHIGGIYSTPELALVIGNIAAFFMSPKVKTKLHIAGRRKYGKNIEDIELIPERKFTYKPGQYVELTLPHTHPDSRGPRRYFTLASSPTEDTLRLGVRYYEHGSTFKKKLSESDEDIFMSAGQLGGDFVMPNDDTKKLAFIAGGVGITPFRSMVKYLLDTNDNRNVTMLYGDHSPSDIAYSELFEEARNKIGIDTKYVITDPANASSPYMRKGRINGDLIETEIPDYTERVFYISGPQPMVREIKEHLANLGVPARNIKVDYFFGYA